ncbi:MAG: CHAT domain-containing protein [bacterium]
MKHRGLTYIVILGVLFLPALIRAQVLSKVVQITTHPSSDTEPAVSKNGKWVAFTSDRSGNRDIWIKKLPHGKVTQVTFNPSDDHQPCWSPDGKWLVFVSHRRDALGDIWLQRIKKGKPHRKPIQMTTFLGEDCLPAVSPDSRKIVFVSEREGRKNLWMLQISSGTITRLTFKGGTEPVWSPDGKQILFISFRDNQYGDLFLLSLPDKQALTPEIIKLTSSHKGRIYSQPYWVSQNNSVVLKKYSVDSDEDNRITPLDKPAIWKADLLQNNSNLTTTLQYDEDREIQLTTDTYSDQHPCTNNQGSIFYSSERNGTQDIYQIPIQGIFPVQKDGYTQYAEALEKSTEAVSDEEISQIILGYQRVLDYFPHDSVWAAKAMLQMGELYRIIGYPEKASCLYDQISIRYPTKENEIASAWLKKATLDIYSMEKRIEMCHNIIKSFENNVSVSAQAWLVLGDVYKQKGQSSESFRCYSYVVNNYPEMKNIQPLARLNIGDIFRQAEQYEAAEQHYISVLREFKDSPLWRKRAAERISENISGKPSQKISSLRKLIHTIEDLPSLQAQAYLQICSILIEQEQFQEAIRELQEIQEMFPALQWVHASSKIMLSEAYQKRGDELKAMYLLQEVSEKFKIVEGGSFSTLAEEKLFGLLTSTAEHLLETGDFELAEVRYRWARRYDPDNISLMRGMVEAGFRAGRGDIVIHQLQDSIDVKPDDPVLLYGLGLALSFKGEENIKVLQQSNTYLKQALGYNYTLIYPYRTLSFNYELIEQLQSQEQERTFWYRLRGIITSPFRWLYNLLPFTQKEEKFRYYEQAIDALITALELNDEQEDPEMEALLAQNLANNFYHLGEFGYKNASEYYRNRLAIDTTFNSLLSKALFYQRLGHSEAMLRLSEAEPMIKKAIHVYKKLDREEEEIWNRRILAFFYQLTEKYDKSVSTYFQLLDYDKRAGNKKELQRDYRNLAYNLFLLAEYNDCLVYAQKSKKLLLEEKISFKPSPKNSLRIEILGLSIPIWSMKQIGGASSEGLTPADELVLVYGLISKSLEKQNKIFQAIEYDKKRLEIFKTRDDVLAERVGYNRLGTLYFKIAEFDKAWNHFFSSLEICRNYNDTQGSQINSLNLSTMAITVQSRFGDSRFLSSAQQVLEKELEIQQSLGSIFQPKQRLILLSTLGTIQLLKAKNIDTGGGAVQETVRAMVDKIRDIQQAQHYLVRADSLADRYHLFLEKSIILKNLSEAACLLKEYPAAYEYLQESYTILTTNRYEKYIWQVLYGMAGIIDNISDQKRHPAFKGKTSLDLYLETIAAMERSQSKEEKISAGFWERRKVYTDCCFELIKRGKYRDGLEIIEKGRQKQITDIITEDPPEFRKERHKLIWGNLTYIQSRLDQLEKQIIRERRISQDKFLNKELLAEKETLEKEYNQILAKMRDEDPMLAYFFGAGTANLTAVQNTLSESHAVLCYLAGQRHSLVWVIVRDTIICRNLDLDERKARYLVEELTGRIQKDSLTAPVCQELYHHLITPVEKYLIDKTELLIVPDDILWNCPFEVLHDGKEYLMDKMTTHYATGLSAYYLATKQKKVNQKRVVSAGSVRHKDFFTSYLNLVRDQTLLLGEEATEPTFLSLSQNADIIHTERWISPRADNPLLTSLVLFPGDGEDGYLSIRELFSTNQNATLFIMPPFSFSEKKEYLSIRLFIETLLYSGIPCVQLNSWAVPEEVKQDFYSSFFSKIGTNSEMQALSRTVKEIRNKYPALKFWGAFRLIGFQGMDEEENKIFSRNNLVNMVKKGRAFAQDKDYDNALRVLGEALDMVYTMDDSLTMVRVLKELVWTSVQGEKWSKAVLYQKPLYNSAKVSENLKLIVNTGNTLSTFYYRNGEYQQAAEIKLFLIENVKGSNVYDIAKLYESLALIYSSAREFDKALERMDQAAEIYQTRKDTASMAKAEIWLGRFELERDNFQLSLQHLKKGLNFLQPAVTQNDKFQLASAYQLIGLAYERLSMYKKAMSYQEKGLSVFSEAGFPLQMAQSWQYIANLEWKTGSYRQAFNSQSKALKGFQDQSTIKHLIMGYSTLGLIKMSLGDFKQAFEDEQRALDLCNKSPEYDSDKASVLKNLGLIMIQRKEFNRSLEYFQQATEIDSSLNSVRGLAYDFRNQGILKLYLKETQEGVELLEKGLTLSREIGDRRNQVRCLYGLARARNELDQNREALLNLDQGLHLINQVVMPEQEWRFHHLRGTVLSQLGDNLEALHSYKQGIEVVESMRAELGVESFKQGFIDKRMDIYTDIITHLVKTGRAEQALNYVERAKSRSFLDMLSRERLDLTAADKHLLTELETARDAIEEARMMITSLTKRRSTSKTEQEIKVWKAALEKRKKEYEQLLVSIKAEHQQLTSLVSVKPWDFSQIKLIIPNEVMLLEYYVTQNNIYCWIIFKNQAVVKEIQIKKHEVTVSITKFRKAINNYLSTQIEANKLYQLLIKPAEQYFTSAEHVIIIPHGVLHYLPFCALQDNQGVYLIEKFSLSQAPSSTVLGYCIEKQKNAREDTQKSVVAFGNPDLGEEKYNLPFAEKEVLSLQRNYDDVTYFLGRQATEQAVRNSVAEKDIIHFSCHATYDAETPLFSSLLLRGEDEHISRLEAREIFGLELTSDLVMLSACKTGLAAVSEGDEIIGMTRSFLYAGTPSIISTLWSVDDLATAVAVKRFYRYLSSGYSKARALQMAQLVVKEMVNAHPAAWASFKLTGEFR